MFDTSATRQETGPAPSDFDVIGPGQVSQFFGFRFEEMSTGEVRAAYRSVVSALMSFRAQKFAPEMEKAKVIRQTTQEESEVVGTDHPWVELTREPSPHLPATLFWENAFKIVDAQGHVDLAVRYESRMGRRVPKHLTIIFPEYGEVTPVYDQSGARVGWDYQKTGGGRNRLPTESIIRLKEPHPTAPWRTAGKLEAAAYEIDEMMAHNIFARDKARNQGRPNVVLKDPGTQTKAEARKKAKEFAEMYNEQTGLTPVERGDMEIKQMDLTPAEMEFLETRRFNVEQLLMIFGIPKGMLSSEDSATGRGRTAAKRQFEEDTVQPFIDKRVEQLSFEFRRIFDAEDSDLRLESPDTVTIPPDTRLDIDMKRLKTGSPLNRILRERGEEEVDGGDESFVTSSVQSLEKARGPSL